MYEGWDGEKLYENNLNYLLMYLNTYYPDDGYEAVPTSSEQRLSKIAYTFEDLNNDGIDELMIFNVEAQENSSYYAGMIYDLYSVVDDKVTLIISSGERDRYYYCSDGLIANEASSSAATSYFSNYKYIYGEGLDFVDMVFFDGYYNQNDPWFYSDILDHENYSNPISEKKAQELKNMHAHIKLSGTIFSDYN